MDEFSIEYMSKSIYNHKTKDYFQEIVSSYNNKNYRSASVMLWSVVVIDLVFKLNDLVDLHDDKAAKSIISKIKKDQEKDKKSSKWEHNLVSKIGSRTQLLSSDNISFLEYLYQQRNLSAHPVLNENLELHKPSKITVRSLISNAVDGVLVKPPFFSKEIVSSIVTDLAEAKDYLEDNTVKLEHYLENRYLSKMTSKVQLEVFKTLWRFVFKIENDNTKENRKINYKALIFIFRKNSSKILDLIDGEAVYFSDISKEIKTISYVINFLSINPEVYSKLEKNAEILIKDRVNKDHRNYFRSNFLYGTLSDFHDDLIEYVEETDDIDLKKSEVRELVKLSDSPDWKRKIYILRNAYYGTSATFVEAENRYEKFISPVLSKYTKEELIDLITRANSNHQIHGRRRNKNINTEVKEACDKILGVGFDYSDYDSFIGSAT